VGLFPGPSNRRCLRTRPDIRRSSGISGFSSSSSRSASSNSERSSRLVRGDERSAAGVEDRDPIPVKKLDKEEPAIERVESRVDKVLAEGLLPFRPSDAYGFGSDEETRLRFLAVDAEA
jgi:hypothetical protein